MPITYRSAAKADIHLSVEYQCHHCGYRNADDSQFLHLRAAARSASGYDAAAAEAREQLADLCRKVLDDISIRRYRSARLTCRCAACHKKPLWVSYWPVTLMKVLCIFAAFAAVILSLLIAMGSAFIPWWAFLIPLLPFVMLLTCKIANSIIDSRLSKADTALLPDIRFLKDEKTRVTAAPDSHPAPPVEG